MWGEALDEVGGACGENGRRPAITNGIYMAPREMEWEEMKLGRLKTRWKDACQRDLKSNGLRAGEETDRAMWRRKINSHGNRGKAVGKGEAMGKAMGKKEKARRKGEAMGKAMGKKEIARRKGEKPWEKGKSQGKRGKAMGKKEKARRKGEKPWDKGKSQGKRILIRINE